MIAACRAVLIERVKEHQHGSEPGRIAGRGGSHCSQRSWNRTTRHGRPMRRADSSRASWACVEAHTRAAFSRTSPCASPPVATGVRPPVLLCCALLGDAGDGVVMGLAWGAGVAREAPLHALVDTMLASYCRGLSFQYAHLPSWEQQQWLRRRAESCALPLTRDEKRAILRRLLRAGASPPSAHPCAAWRQVHSENPTRPLRCRRLRVVPRRQVSREQALWPRGLRGGAPGAAHAGGGRRRSRHRARRDWHGAPRAPQCAAQPVT